MRTMETMTEPELQALMLMTCKGIEMIAREMEVEKPLFCVLMFNDPAVAQFAANCDRTTMIAALRETADRLENREFVPR